MCPECHRGLRNPVAGARSAELRIDQVPGVASRPAGVGAVDHLVDGLRRLVVSQPVASHVGGPRAARRRIDPHAHRIPEAGHVDPARATLGWHEVDRRSPRIGLDTDVAGRPGREQQLPVRQHGDRPGGVPAGSQALQDDGSICLPKIAVQGEAEEARLAGHEQAAVGRECHRVRGFEAASNLDGLVGPAVRVTVREGHDPVGASLGDEQHPIRRDVHEPGRCEALGEDRDLVFVGDDELREAARSDVDVDAHRTLNHGPPDNDDGECNQRRDDREQTEVADPPHQAPLRQARDPTGRRLNAGRPGRTIAPDTRQTGALRGDGWIAIS